MLAKQLKENITINTVIGSTTDIAAIPSNTTSVIAIIKKIYETCISLVTSILVLTETGGTVTTDGTLQVLFIHDAPAGVYSPQMLIIDLTNQFAGTVIEIGLYYRIKSGGDYRQIDLVEFDGRVPPFLKVISLKENRFGVYVTIEKTAGDDRDYDFEVFYKI